MKKILLTTTALIAMSASAFADDYKNNHYPTQYDEGKISPLSGFYLGGYGGYGWNSVDTAGADASVDGADYGVFVGYSLDTLLDHTIGMGINGSLEGFYGWSNADDDAGGVSYEKDNDWGISFRPGLSFIQDYTLGLKPYGIIGYRRTEFQASTPTASVKDWHNGLELGIGTEVIAYGNMGVRVDYSHVWYEDKNGLDPDGNDVRMGLSYHF